MSSFSFFLLVELTPCVVEKQQCLDLAQAAKTPDKPSKRPRTDMNQAHIDVLELERERNLLQIEVLNLQKEQLQIVSPLGKHMLTL